MENALEKEEDDESNRVRYNGSGKEAVGNIMN